MRFNYRWLAISLALMHSSVTFGGVELGFHAGFSAVEIATTDETSISGYGYGSRRLYPFTWTNLLNFSFKLFRTGTGNSDPVRAKAAVFRDGDRKLVWISVDVVGITRDFYEDVLAALKGRGYREGEVFISATHTHSGPGNVSRNLFWEVAAVDWFNPLFYGILLREVEEVVQRAERNLVPASLFSVSGDTVGLQSNRRKKGDPVDTRARLLIARERGSVEDDASARNLGVFVNYAIHGTAYGPENLEFSADVPGAIEKAMETDLGFPVAMLINGAEGDVAPAENGRAGIQRIAAGFSQQVRTMLSSATPVTTQWRVESQEVTLPASYLDVRKCTSFDPAAVGGGFSPFTLIKAFGTDRHGISLPLSRWVASKAKIWKIDLGNISILTWPGEPTSSVGTALRKVARAKGWGEPWIFALTNDYHAYFTSPDEFAGNTYESCFSLHGGLAGEAVLRGFRSFPSLSTNRGSEESLAGLTAQ